MYFFAIEMTRRRFAISLPGFSNDWPRPAFLAKGGRDDDITIPQKAFARAGLEPPVTFQRGEKTVGPVLDVVVREHPEQRVVSLTPLSQRHRARLPDGRRDAVRIVRIDQQYCSIRGGPLWRDRA
jgi:hypothetical protein